MMIVIIADDKLLNRILSPGLLRPEKDKRMRLFAA
jgi:hypothetical protein